MPARISRSSLPKARPSKPQSGGGHRATKKAAKRALEAFAIASHEAPDRNKIRKGRLGESDVDARRKRPRNEDEEDEDEEENGADVKRRKQARGGNESYDEGSDSDGNNWKMGHVDDDDDSDIDSDEAFGESDEERFEGWTFRGHQKSGKPKKQAKRLDMEDGDEDIDLDEQDSGDDEDEDEDEDDDLGKDAIDLATALDQYEESEEDEKSQKAKISKKKKKVSFDDSDESPSEADDIAADGASDFSSGGEDDEEDEEDREAQLKDLISSLAAEEEQKSAVRGAEIHESSAPSEFGVARKVDLASFKSKTADPERRKALKLLQDDKPSTKRNDISRKLDAPLPKRQQDKIDRAAANAKAEETLNRWVDTVKHNRQAEHLHFPLNQSGGGSRMGETRLLATTTSAPTNELESTIQSILQQSGLSNGHEDEEKIQKWETLQTNKLPLEEVMKRRAQLRMERELLFREEVRAKRVKKIKSKAYRRVHRKERERLLQRERDALKADGVDISEDEREYNDRRRAEERMGAKHRDSKWAKGVKASGKAAWDEDARSGVSEMARRNEELRRRMEGKQVQDEDEDASDLSSEDEDDDDDDDDDDADGNPILQRQLARLKENPFSTKESKLGSMAFMQKAENARRAQNDEDIERIRKELAGEESNSEEDEDETSARAGRRKFGPESNKIAPAIQIRKSEFEERAGSGSEDENEVENGTKPTTTDEGKSSISSSNKPNPPKKNKNSLSSAPRLDFDDEATNPQQNPYLVKAKKDKKTSTSSLSQPASNPTTTSQPQQPPKDKKPAQKKQPTTTPSTQGGHGLAGNPTLSAPDADGFQTVTYASSPNATDDSDLENEGIDLDSALAAAITRNNALTASAFASDAGAVESEFAAEKAQLEKDLSPTEPAQQETLPGWGSWTGEAISNKKKKRPPRNTTNPNKTKTNKKNKEADTNERVILTHRRQKANTRYLAPQLPFPFETKAQYERGLRMPLGAEWTTKQSHQQATLPRVLVKRGVAIGPVRKPLV